MRHLICAVSVGALLTMSGCATIIKGHDASYPIHSTPAGATVTIDGMTYGQTPMVVGPDRSIGHMIQIVKVGCPAFHTFVQSRISPWVWGNILFGGLIGLIVDFSSNAAYDLHPNTLAVTYGERDGQCVITGNNLVMVKAEPPTPDPVRPGYTAYESPQGH